MDVAIQQHMTQWKVQQLMRSLLVQDMWCADKAVLALTDRVVYCQETQTCHSIAHQGNECVVVLANGKVAMAAAVESKSTAVHDTTSRGNAATKLQGTPDQYPSKCSKIPSLLGTRAPPHQPRYGCYCLGRRPRQLAAVDVFGCRYVAPYGVVASTSPAKTAL